MKQTKAQPRLKQRKQAAQKGVVASDAQMAFDFTAALKRPLLLIEETEQIARMSDRTLRREEAAGRFPKRISISAKRVAHRTSQVKAWLEGTWVAPAVSEAA